MTHFGLTTGFGDPLGAELLTALEEREVDVARQSLRPDSNLEACVQDFAGRRIRPLFLIPRLADINTQMRPLLTAIVGTLHESADVGVGNESSINGEDIPQAVGAVELTQHLADELGFTGRIYASSIPNLEPRRDFDWMRAFWPRLSKEVVRDFHRYPEMRYPWQIDDRHPWHQFGSLEAELDAVLSIAGNADVAITEFAHSTVIRKWGMRSRQVTNEQAADYLTDDLVLYTRAGLVDAMPYQLNSGSDPEAWGDCQGIRDVQGNWLPQSECFARARAILAGS